MAPKSTEEHEKKGTRTGANYRYTNSADGNTRLMTESGPKTVKTGGFKILAFVLGALLVMAVGVIVLLMSRSPVPAGNEVASSFQGAAQSPADPGNNSYNPSAGGNPSMPATQTVCGNVTLTVESHCQYTANLIPADVPLPVTSMRMDGITYQSDTVQFYISDCSTDTVHVDVEFAGESSLNTVLRTCGRERVCALCVV